MTALGWIIMVVGALIIGAVAQWLMRNDALPYRWMITAIAAFIGGAVSSEALFSSATPTLEGMAFWPALIGGIVVGVVVDLIAQSFGKRAPGGQDRGAAIR